MNKKYIIFVAIFGGIIVIFMFFYNAKNQEYSEILIEENNTIVEVKNIIEGTENEKTKIKIHITGEVNCQGIIEIEEGGRIADAIETAGGLTTMADITKVNLAYVLEDGQKLYIPSIEDVNFNQIYEGSGENIIDGNVSKTNKVNINKASEEELQKISGVGPSLAIKIIEYRENNGKFKTIDDLKNVSGIGEKKFETIKDFIAIK